MAVLNNELNRYRMSKSENCTKEKHYNCGFFASFVCNCVCHKSTFTDIFEKCAAASAGVLTILAGLLTTMSSLGISVPAGGALIGGGISSTLLAIEKTMNNQRLELNEYLGEVGFGAMTGAATSGIVAVSEQVAKVAVRKTAKQGIKKLAFRTGAGALAGVVAKSIDELKQVTVTDKPFIEYGQIINEDGYVDVAATLSEWGAGMGIGAIGGASRHINSNVAKHFDMHARVALSSATAAVSDITQQGMNISAGKQQGYNPHQTFKNVAKSVAKSSLIETGKKLVESVDK